MTLFSLFVIYFLRLQRKPLKSSPFIPELSNPTHPVEDVSSQPAEPSQEPEEEPSSVKGPEEAPQLVRTSSAVLPALEISEASQLKGGTEEATAVQEPAGTWGVSDPDVAAAQLEQAAAPLGLNSAVSSEASAPGRLGQVTLKVSSC